MFAKLNFKITIQAPKETVWSVLWNDVTYREWTKVFSEDSHAVSNWQEGSSVMFLDGNGSGMFSKIYKSIPNSFMGFEHLGIVKDHIKQPIDEKTKAWSGAKEDYTLTEKNGMTHLEVSLDSDKEFESYFKNTFPKALEIVKNLSENN
ncbi:SRPBCC domain-containing protein [Mariniflexile gromovii]|uniref:SRPBCC domain-containing protein n=1 Tax=Mariniflexile gromovii TaxID=362523 RepID=A0ABS4BPL7_9FLAO|nr:SRPBCC domain-containing protein [Mariniflexile gromovii]MBP0902526.1 SRPBCC domain-containing protein [Mariniflexile gromovii]